MEKEKKCCSPNSIVRSKGEFLIQVLREGFTIHKPLPYCIWGAIYLNANNFATVLQPYNTGMIITTAIVNGNIVFTYQEGPFIDRITVSANPNSLISYAEMLANLNTSFLRSEVSYFSNNTEASVLPILSDQNNAKLQLQPLFLTKIGGGGEKKNEMIVPYSRRLQNNSLKDVIELTMRNQEIKADTVWIHQFGYITQGGNFDTLQFSFLVVINEIINLNDEKRSIAEIKESSQLGKR